MTVDRDQIRRNAEEIGDSPGSFRLHGFARDVLALLTELEQAEVRITEYAERLEAVRDLRAQAERERDEARKALEELTDAAEGVYVYPEGAVGLEELVNATNSAHLALDRGGT